MVGGKQKKKKNKETKEASLFSNYSAPARNMRKADLGAVVFGCKHNTINECLFNQLFGLPASHYSYIKNISQGLVLFLFNYSDRTLHGIFEAASPGQMNINKYAWTEDGDGTEYTIYPAQVRVHVRQQCQPLTEDQFRPIIANNYYETKLFYFELDHDQTNKLILLFKSSLMNISASPKNTTMWNNLSSSLHARSGTQNWKMVAGFDHSDQTKEKGSAWDDDTLPTRLSENPTKLSYASVLNNISTATTATSSLHPRKWSALFKTQEDEEKTDFHQANTWEETYTTNSECVQTWESDIMDKWPPNQECEGKADDSLQEDTWEDNELIASTTNEVERVKAWASESSSEESDEPYSSPQPEAANSLHNCSSEVPLDDNQDCQLASSIETNENDVEENNEKDGSLVANTVIEMATDLESLVVKLLEEVKVLKGSQLKQIVKTNLLEQELVESKLEIQQLSNRLGVLESGSRSIVDPAEADKRLSKPVDFVFIIGGYDGSSWLSTLDSYCPSRDIKTPLNPMKFIKKYASAASLNGELYHFGGMGSHTVESFSPTKNEWVRGPPLYWKNINAAGASLKDRLFAIGGSNGRQCCSEVEHLDLNIGEWHPTRSMQSKRLAPAAAELNNILYVTGGYDGTSYVSSVERFDPREEAWYELPSMNTKKACHSLIVLNEKLYALGGFDGDKYIPTVESFDPRIGAWMNCEPMNVSRGNFGAFVLGEKLYAIGGSKENEEALAIVECYKEGGCWEVVDLEAIAKRSHFSAIVL